MIEADSSKHTSSLSSRLESLERAKGLAVEAEDFIRAAAIKLDIQEEKKHMELQAAVLAENFVLAAEIKSQLDILGSRNSVGTEKIAHDSCCFLFWGVKKKGGTLSKVHEKKSPVSKPPQKKESTNKVPEKTKSLTTPPEKKASRNEVPNKSNALVKSAELGEGPPIEQKLRKKKSGSWLQAILTSSVVPSKEASIEIESHDKRSEREGEEENKEEDGEVVKLWSNLSEAQVFGSLSPREENRRQHPASSSSSFRDAPNNRGSSSSLASLAERRKVPAGSYVCVHSGGVSFRVSWRSREERAPRRKSVKAGEVLTPLRVLRKNGEEAKAAAPGGGGVVPPQESGGRGSSSSSSSESSDENDPMWIEVEGGSSAPPLLYLPIKNEEGDKYFFEPVKANVFNSRASFPTSSSSAAAAAAAAAAVNGNGKDLRRSGIKAPSSSSPTKANKQLGSSSPSIKPIAGGGRKNTARATTTPTSKSSQLSTKSNTTATSAAPSEAASTSVNQKKKKAEAAAAAATRARVAARNQATVQRKRGLVEQAAERKRLEAEEAEAVTTATTAAATGSKSAKKEKREKKEGAPGSSNDGQGGAARAANRKKAGNTEPSIIPPSPTPTTTPAKAKATKQSWSLKKTISGSRLKAPSFTSSAAARALSKVGGGADKGSGGEKRFQAHTAKQPQRPGKEEGEKSTAVPETGNDSNSTSSSGDEDEDDEDEEEDGLAEELVSLPSSKASGGGGTDEGHSFLLKAGLGQFFEPLRTHGVLSLGEMLDEAHCSDALLAGGCGLGKAQVHEFRLAVFHHRNNADKQASSFSDSSLLLAPHKNHGGGDKEGGRDKGDDDKKEGCVDVGDVGSAGLNKEAGEKGGEEEEEEEAGRTALLAFAKQAYESVTAATAAAAGNEEGGEGGERKETIHAGGDRDSGGGGAGRRWWRATAALSSGFSRQQQQQQQQQQSDHEKSKPFHTKEAGEAAKAAGSKVHAELLLSSEAERTHTKRATMHAEQLSKLLFDSLAATAAAADGGGSTAAAASGGGDDDDDDDADDDDDDDDDEDGADTEVKATSISCLDTDAVAAAAATTASTTRVTAVAATVSAAESPVESPVKIVSVEVPSGDRPGFVWGDGGFVIKVNPGKVVDRAAAACRQDGTERRSAVVVGWRLCALEGSAVGLRENHGAIKERINTARGARKPYLLTFEPPHSPPLEAVPTPPPPPPQIPAKALPPPLPAAGPDDEPTYVDTKCGLAAPITDIDGNAFGTHL